MELLNKIQIQQKFNFLKGLVEFLSLDFQMQRSKSPLPEDMIADDIAEDWDWNFIGKMVDFLRDSNIFNDNIVQIFKQIEGNFSNASLNGILYEEIIWTAEGLEFHHFWKVQRKLAKLLLYKMEQIQF